MEIHVLPAPWGERKADLRAIRDLVFIQEQAVPEELEHDGNDDVSQHFIAINSAGQVLGCARLQPTGQIGRMAVLPNHRSLGIGTRLLEAAIDTAKQAGLTKVFLHAQINATEFYRRAGFLPVGQQYMEAGISHQSMEMELPIPFEPTKTTSKPFIRALHNPSDAPLPPVVSEDAVPFEGNPDALTSLIDGLETAQRSVALYSQLLDPRLFDDPRLIAQISEFVRRAPTARLRILVHSTRLLVNSGHRLLELARRLDSKVQIRCVREEYTQDQHSCVVWDKAGYWIVPDHEVYKGLLHLQDSVRARRLTERFDYLWEHSIEDPELRVLSL